MSETDQGFEQIRLMCVGTVCQMKKQLEGFPVDALDSIVTGLVPMLVTVMREHLSKEALKRVGAVATRIALALENVE